MANDLRTRENTKIVSSAILIAKNVIELGNQQDRIISRLTEQIMHARQYLDDDTLYYPSQENLNAAKKCYDRALALKDYTSKIHDKQKEPIESKGSASSEAHIIDVLETGDRKKVRDILDDVLKKLESLKKFLSSFDAKLEDTKKFISITLDRLQLSNETINHLMKTLEVPIRLYVCAYTTTGEVTNARHVSATDIKFY
jgi:hypothetical protein